MDNELFDIAIYLAVLVGTILFPPVIETILLRRRHIWVGCLAGGFSVFPLLLPLTVFPLPQAANDPYGESQGMGLLFVFGMALVFAIAYLSLTLLPTIILSLVWGRSSRRQFPYRMYYFRPWITMGMLILLAVLVILVSILRLFPDFQYLIFPIFTSIFSVGVVGLRSPLLSIGTGLFIGFIGYTIAVTVKTKSQGILPGKSSNRSQHPRAES